MFTTIISRSSFRQAAVILAAAAVLPAWAESPTVNTEIDRAVSSKTRAEVIAELQQGRVDGTMRKWSSSYNPLHSAKSLKSRAEVRAELAASRDVPALTTEDSGSFAMVQPQSHGATIRVAQR